MPSQPNPIQFHFLESVPALKQRRRLKAFLLEQTKASGHTLAHINYIFCSDNYLLELNRTHLQHDYYTDIITFQLNPEDQPLQADIYISIDRVRDNASQFQSTFVRELHRVIFHGLLHCLGFKDKSEREAKRMRQMEDKFLALYFVPRGT